jgi:geranylgeranyl diphosphate synthase, type II
MKRFQQLSQEFSVFFNKNHFPDQPETLYGAASYMIADGGKRVRPVLCLLGNELFGPIVSDTWKIAVAIELFHNFTLIHDDIMDKAPLRRGRPTVHARYDEPTALLAGDVMLLRTYDYLNETDARHTKTLIRLLNKTGREVCEGQQMDMDFEKIKLISPGQYLQMIELKTAVFLAASLQMGAEIAGAGNNDQDHLYAFGKNIGLAFQIQDDWLDSFGDPATFGKQNGGDILANKKTFLLVHALAYGSADEKSKIEKLLESAPEDKIEKMIELFRATGADQAAREAKLGYIEKAFSHLDLIGVPPENKTALRELADYLLERAI